MLSNGEIYTAYITAANQTLRPQDERIALAFAREIETAVLKAQAGEQYGQVTPTYDELVKQVSELNRLYKFDNRTMEDLVSKLDAFKVVCEKAARSIEYLLERATDSDDSAYGTLSTNFVRDCLRVNLTELNDVLGLENYVE